METIYKFNIPVLDGTCTVILPKRHKVLKVGVDLDNLLCLWAAVDAKDTEVVCKEFICLWTGEDIPEVPQYKYLNTLECRRHVTDGCTYIYHIFEKQGA